jgi:alanine-alpha-ketoisovalerate/valine-pyruvate aminotransferase
MTGFRQFATVALLVAAGLGCTSRPGGPASRVMALPFIENDFAQAVSLARERNVPLFVEVWAPW